LPVACVKNIAQDAAVARKRPEAMNGMRGPKLLRDWRRRTKTSQQTLADQMGLKHSASIYQYEAGRLPFTYAHLVSLQKITGISAWDLAWPGQVLVMRDIGEPPAAEQQ
jgi:transcriptional regulator with XRE-family HTH domain